MDDALDQRRELRQRVRLLVEIGVPVIDVCDARLDVAQRPLGDVGADAGAGQEAAGGSSQIVHHPIGHAAHSIEPRFVLRMAVAVALPAAGEHKRIALEDWQSRRSGRGPTAAA